MNRDDIVKRVAAAQILREEDTTPLTRELLLELIRYAQDARAYQKNFDQFDVRVYMENYRYFAGACGCMGPRGFSYCACMMGWLLEQYKWDVLLELTDHGEQYGLA